jgi:2-oxoacid:acceptor oxidoreductase delta subunit (pyruvate/2-ketoisovalerate family)
VAVGHGARAARGIDAYLAGRPVAEPEPVEPATFERLNTWYFADAPRTRRDELERVRRQGTFDEVVVGLTEENAVFEARRCLSCGNCFGCDNCFAVCPDNAVLKLGSAGDYDIDYDYCKGCGICAHECPCGAIDMVPEQI